jgi:hypothetical protein
MTKWARIIESDGIKTIAEVVTKDPATLFTAQIAALFVPVSEDAEYRATWSDTDGKWIPVPLPDPEPVEPPAPEPVYPKVSPVEFKLLFTSAERVAIKAVRATDVVIADFFDIVEDPRLTMVDLSLKSTQDALSYLVMQNLLTEERRAEILVGQIQ